MPFSNNVISFEIPNISHGFKKASGLVKLENEHILFEFRVTDAIVEMFESEVKEVKIPLSDIRTVTFKKSWFSAKMILTADSLRVFEEIPGTDNAECVLNISRKNRKDAEKLVSRMRVILSEMRLRDLENED